MLYRVKIKQFQRQNLKKCLTIKIPDIIITKFIAIFCTSHLNFEQQNKQGLFMSIGPDEIKAISHLARLKIDDDKVEKISADIQNILKFVDQLQLADTSGIEPMAHPMDATQILRADEITETNNRDKLMSVAPATEDGLFLVPQVIE